MTEDVVCEKLRVNPNKTNEEKLAKSTSYMIRPLPLLISIGVLNAISFNNVIYLFIYLFVLQRCLLSVCLPFGSFLGRFFASFFFFRSLVLWFGLVWLPRHRN